MLVLWLCAMLVLLQNLIEEDKGFLMHQSTLPDNYEIAYFIYKN